MPENFLMFSILSLTYENFVRNDLINEFFVIATAKRPIKSQNRVARSTCGRCYAKSKQKETQAVTSLIVEAITKILVLS